VTEHLLRGLYMALAPLSALAHFKHAGVPVTLISRLRGASHDDQSRDRRPRDPDMTSRGERVIDAIDVFGE